MAAAWPPPTEPGAAPAGAPPAWLVDAVVRASFDSAPDGLVVITRDGLLLAWNQAFVALWGFPPEMLARRDVREMRSHSAAQLREPEAYLSSLERLAGTAGSQVFDQVPLADGRLFERHVSPLQVDGAGDALVVRWRDISARHRAEQALAHSQARLAALWDNTLSAILLADDHGRCLDANPAACALLGVARQALIGRDVADMVLTGPASGPAAWAAFLQAGKASGQVQLRRPDGQLVQAAFNAVAHMQPGVHLTILSDLTDSLRQEQRQQELMALMDLAMVDADLVFWDADLRSGHMQSLNNRWHAMLGYGHDEVPDTLDAWDALVHPDDAQARALAWDAHLRGRTPNFETEFRIRHKQGHWVWIQARARVVERGPGGEPLRLAGLRMNITRRKQTETRLEGLAHTDALTGVLNRGRFTDLAADELSRAQRHGTPAALLMIDLDHFKSVNDRLGHAGGDAVLRSFAATAGSVMRQGDLFGRVGGEEFAALLPQTTLEGAVVLAERLRQCVRAQPVAVAGAPLVYTVSIGVAAWAPDEAGEASIDRLMVAADHALYAAKGQGRDRVACGAG